jgi:hypothetical protein
VNSTRATPKRAWEVTGVEFTTTHGHDETGRRQAAMPDMDARYTRPGLRGGDHHPVRSSGALHGIYRLLVLDEEAARSVWIQAIGQARLGFDLDRQNQLLALLQMPE